MVCSVNKVENHCSKGTVSNNTVTIKMYYTNNTQLKT